MLKIYTVEFSTAGDVTVPAVFERDNLDAARIAYHQFMASCISNPNCTEATCMIINSNASVLVKDRWKKEEATDE